MTVNPQSETTPLTPPSPPHGAERLEDLIASLFAGPGGIRAGWRFFMFTIIFFLIAGIVLTVFAAAYVASGNSNFLTNLSQPTAGVLLLEEVIFGIATFIAAFLMSKIEGRRIEQYGMPLNEAFGRRFWEGVIWGLVAISVTVFLIAVLHGVTFATSALSGSALVGYAMSWAVVFLLTGFFEEFSYRGYGQFTLTTGMGFWPSAIVLSLIFGAGHLGNKGESWAGAFSAALAGYFFCFTLRRTGTIWFAIGMHAAWDYGETFVFGTPDSGIVASGHLLSTSFHGPRWLTGGSVGPEASAVYFLVCALLFLVFHFLYPA